MNQMSVNSVLSLFPETKSEISTFVEKAVESALNGYVSPLKMQVQMAALEQVLKGIKENPDFKWAVMTDAERYNQKTFKEYNSQIQIKEVGVKYDYSVCNHPQYDRLCEKINELTEQKKLIEKFLQALNGNQYDFIDPETGEQCVISKPIKTSTTSVVITINK